MEKSSNEFIEQYKSILTKNKKLIISLGIDEREIEGKTNDDIYSKIILNIIEKPYLLIYDSIYDLLDCLKKYVKDGTKEDIQAQIHAHIDSKSPNFQRDFLLLEPDLEAENNIESLKIKINLLYLIVNYTLIHLSEVGKFDFLLITTVTYVTNNLFNILGKETGERFRFVNLKLDVYHTLNANEETRIETEVNIEEVVEIVRYISKKLNIRIKFDPYSKGNYFDYSKIFQYLKNCYFSKKENDGLFAQHEACESKLAFSHESK